MTEWFVTGPLKIYYQHNTKITHYAAMTRNLIYQWVALGWTQAVTREYILNADITVRHKRKQ